jgi:hypothetical protein
MRLFMKRVGDGLRPDGPEDFVDFSKLPIGKLLSVEVRQSRSLAQLRLWWGLARRIGDSVGVQAEAVSDLLLIEAGHYEVLRSKSHGDILRAKSIAFAALPHDEFNALFDRAVEIITFQWGIERRDVLDAVADLLPSARQELNDGRS